MFSPNLSESTERRSFDIAEFLLVALFEIRAATHELL